MTEFWKSNERHFCEICQCWLDAKKNSIRAHEEGKGHKEKFIEYQTKLREGKSSAVAAKTAEEKEWEKIDAAAKKAHEADLRAQGIQIPSSSSSTATSTPSTTTTAVRPPPPSQPPSSTTSSSAPKPSLWQATVDPSSGATYYFHIQTRETRWTNPEEDDKTKPTKVDEEKKSRKQKREEYEASNKERAAEQAAKKKQQQEQEAAGETGTQKGDKDKVTEGKEEEEKNGEEQKLKKQKTETTTAAVNSAPVSEDVDEDTGFGKWASVAPTAAPSAAELQAAANLPRMSPFGLVQPEKASGGATSSSTDPAAAPKRYSNFAADDADEADEDLVVGGVDTAQALRNQFGPSALVATAAKKGYEAGTDLLEDDSNASAPVAVSFKKKANRGNQRKPVVASNTEE